MTFKRKLLGISGEKAAVQYLKKKSYKILENNFRCPLGELDIICRAKGLIIFVEVKTRKTSNFGSPLEAVNDRKQHQIAKAALSYIKAKALYKYSFRFDVISITGSPDKQPEILHIENAFPIDKYMF
ncbi:MAG: YraN family protein [Candidatus Theseobacter exili]|nr:YraN family protein [Candidatus Theseobacter exili]